ncbi:PIN domain-like protein [Tricholoma matsutake]|nr:PIN domain-like protein [Tricholoma matsutake 945]
MATRMTLHQLAVDEGFVNIVGGVCMLRVGINVSGWIFCASYLHGQTKNLELAILFGWCMWLLQLPVLPLFVFDGKCCPKVKRDKAVCGNPHWITHDMKEMLGGFGFAWAPGEAEAELAWMNNSSIVDAVLTKDSDVVIFGAQMILQIPSADEGEGKVIMYKVADIHTHPTVCLEPADLLLVALLAGGDYYLVSPNMDRIPPAA